MKVTTEYGSRMEIIQDTMAVAWLRGYRTPPEQITDPPFAKIREAKNCQALQDATRLIVGKGSDVLEGVVGGEGEGEGGGAGRGDGSGCRLTLKAGWMTVTFEGGYLRRGMTGKGIWTGGSEDLVGLYDGLVHLLTSAGDRESVTDFLEMALCGEIEAVTNRSQTVIALVRQVLGEQVVRELEVPEVGTKTAPGVDLTGVLGRVASLLDRQVAMRVIRFYLEKLRLEFCPGMDLPDVMRRVLGLGGDGVDGGQQDAIGRFLLQIDSLVNTSRKVQDRIGEHQCNMLIAGKGMWVLGLGDKAEIGSDDFFEAMGWKGSDLSESEGLILVEALGKSGVYDLEGLVREGKRLGADAEWDVGVFKALEPRLRNELHRAHKIACAAYIKRDAKSEAERA